MLSVAVALYILPTNLPVPAPSVAAPAVETPPSDVRAELLENGLGFVVSRQCPDDGTGLITVNLDIAVGFYQDPPRLAEVAHITEHVVVSLRDAKGDVITERWRPAIFNGQTANASTDARNTRYWFTVPASQVADVLSFVRRIFDSESIAERDVEIHKRLVVAEGFSTRDERAQKLLNRAQGSGPFSLGLPRMDLIKSVRRVRYQDVKAFHDRYYQPQNSIITVTGCFDAKALSNEVSSALNKIRSKGKLSDHGYSAFKDPTNEPSFFQAIDDGAKKALLSISMASKGATAQTSRELTATKIVHGLLLNRLRKLKEEQPLRFPGELVVLEGTGFDALRSGALAIRAEVVPGHVADATNVILQTMAQARNASSEEIDKARDYAARQAPADAGLDQYVAGVRGGLPGRRLPIPQVDKAITRSIGDEDVRREILRLTDPHGLAVGYYSNIAEMTASYVDLIKASLSRTIPIEISQEIDTAPPRGKPFRYPIEFVKLRAVDIENIIYFSHLLRGYRNFKPNNACEISRIHISNESMQVSSDSDLSRPSSMQAAISTCISDMQGDAVFAREYSKILRSSITYPQEILGGETNFHRFMREHYLATGEIISLSNAEEIKLLRGGRNINRSISRLEAAFRSQHRGLEQDRGPTASSQLEFCPGTLDGARSIKLPDDDHSVSNINIMFYIGNRDYLLGAKSFDDGQVSAIKSALLRRLRADEGLTYDVMVGIFPPIRRKFSILEIRLDTLSTDVRKAEKLLWLEIDRLKRRPDVRRTDRDILSYLNKSCAVIMEK